MSRAVDLLVQIRSGWLTRVSRNLARGAGVRESFLIQLDQFYDSLQQSVMTGDPAWMEPLLLEWAGARTETELADVQTTLSHFITKILNITTEYIREILSSGDGMVLLIEILPVFSSMYESVAVKEIETRVALVSKDLNTARNSLERLDKSKSDFISVAAHELKTPLTLIEGYASMLAQIFSEEPDASQPVILTKGIDNGTRRLREIIDDMIDVSLIDNNLLTINFQPVWISRLISAIFNELQGTVKERNQNLEIRSFSGSSTMTFGDPERIYQAFKNLITNAIKYTPDGGSILVYGRKLPGFLEITVSDTGIGIDPENHHRIFDKFGQIGNASLHSSGKMKFKGGGPGLGLPITKGIIEAHGGTIWVESPGHDEVSCPGATFHVMIPLYDEPPDPKTAKLFQPLLEMQ